MDKLYIKDKCIETLVALTLDEQKQGLMHQAWPPPVMAFPYSKASIKKFWMKNTPSPLDILFCYQNKIIYKEQGFPFSLREFGPNSPVDLVVEMPLGLPNKLGVNVGDSITLKYGLKTLAKKFDLQLKGKYGC